MLRPSTRSSVILLGLACALGAADPAAAQDPAASEDRLSFSGDFRLRGESRIHRDDQDDRFRMRGRFRAGIGYRIHEELSAGARAITGNRNDPRSPHYTFGSNFDSLEVSLDRLFLRWQPSGADGLTLVGGKFANPLRTNPVYGELVWDGDVQPEGIAATWSPVPGFAESLTLVAGGLVVQESSNARDTFAGIAQASATFEIADGTTATIGAGATVLGDPSPATAPALAGRSTGNATVDRNADGLPDDFASGFAIFDVLADLRCDLDGTPLVFSAQYLQNPQAVPDTQHGYALGVAAGARREPGDWQFYYQWQVIEQDAVFTPFAQDDFVLTSNHRTHLLGVHHRASRDVGLHLWASGAARDHVSPRNPLADSDEPQWTVRFDVNVSF